MESGAVTSLHENRARAESFGSVAEAYDRYRPRYPQALINDLAALAPRRVLDVGTGTGIAAAQLHERGLDVLGLEIDARMADVARAKGIPVEVAPFETWDDGGRRFDLITAAQSWHWVDPVHALPKAVRLLRPRGTLALFWNHDETKDDRDAIPAVGAVYEEFAPEIGWESTSRPAQATFADSLRGSGLFRDVRVTDYRCVRSYTAAEWIGTVGTHSDHLALPPERRERLFAALTSTIEGMGGTLRLRGGCYTIFAHT